MNKTAPRLCIGLPVFNGVDYLQEVLDSLLGQTFSDFELIISDNASTDGTPDICRAYVAKDRRIRYCRNQGNIGAIQNWYRTFDLSSGEYFAGAAHDDVYAPEFMEKCIEVLDQKPSVVLCYPKTKVIDAQGRFVRNFDLDGDTNSVMPHVRLYNMIAIDLLCIQMYGVFRASSLRKIHVYTGYVGCDRNTLAELSLLGQIYEIPEYLFYHRLYPRALGVALRSGRTLQELFFLDPGTNWRSHFPGLIRFRNYFAVVTSAPLSRTERFLCYLQLARLIVDKSMDRIRRHWGHARD